MVGKPVLVRLALLGVGMLLLTAVIILTAALIEPEALVFALINGVPALIVGAAIYFWRPWGLIVGVLGGLLGLLFHGTSLPLALSSPNSFYDFSSTVLGTLGAVCILVGSVGGLIQHFRRSETFTISPAVRTGVMGVLGLLLVVNVISAVLTVASIGGVSAADEQGATIVIGKKVVFEPESFTARANQNTRVVFKNKDPILHTLTIDALDIDAKIGPGAEKLIEFSAPAGTYEYHCRITGHEDMKGTLTIQ